MRRKIIIATSLIIVVAWRRRFCIHACIAIKKRGITTTTHQCRSSPRRSRRHDVPILPHWGQKTSHRLQHRRRAQPNSGAARHHQLHRRPGRAHRRSAGADRSAPIPAQIEQLTANRDRDQAQLTNAIANLNRYTPLEQKGYATPQLLETQQAQVSQLQNAIKSDRRHRRRQCAAQLRAIDLADRPALPEFVSSTSATSFIRPTPTGSSSSRKFIRSR